MAMTKEEELKEELITTAGSSCPKKSKIVSYLQSNRKKVFYFVLFTLLKIGIWVLFFQ